MKVLLKGTYDTADHRLSDRLLGAREFVLAPVIGLMMMVVMMMVMRMMVGRRGLLLLGIRRSVRVMLTGGGMRVLL